MFCSVQGWAFVVGFRVTESGSWFATSRMSNEGAFLPYIMLTGMHIVT